MSTSNNPINNTVGASISGVTNTFTVTNASNTASSAARSKITVGGGSAADPTINFNVAGVTDWEMGIDNSVSDNLTISQGTALGTNDTWRMNTSGQRTMPLQPSFLGISTGGDSNVTGDNTVFVFGSGTALTEVFDRSASFTTAGIFTAPVTGLYYLFSYIQYTNVGAAHITGDTTIGTTARAYTLCAFNPFNCFNTAGGVGFSGSVLANMTAGDTAFVACRVGGGAKTVGINNSYFGGYLVC